MSVWLDVTTSLSWTRPAVGVVRTELECADYFLSVESNDVKFCIFDKNAVAYAEVSPIDVKAAIDRIKSSSEVAPGESTCATDGIVTDRFTAMVKRGIRNLPQPIRGKAFSFAKSKQEPVYRFITRMKGRVHRIRNTFRPTPAASDSVRLGHVQKATEIFGKNDVYISLGLDWDQKDLPYLYSIKKSLDLKVVLFCYDLIPIKYPHLCVGDVVPHFAKYFSDVAWCADSVLCISESTRIDLRKFLDKIGSPVPSTRVVRLGDQVDAQELLDEPLSEYIREVTQEPYLLFVSTIERRKNHETLYRAYIRLLESGRENLPRLVFVGMRGWGVENLMSDLQLDPRIQDRILLLDKVKDKDLTFLYENALFTLYPSLYEGWGLPVAESLALGKVCLASNSSSIPEIGGSLVEYLDPWDVPKWAERIGAYIDDPECLKAKEKTIAENYRITFWESTARSVLEAAEELHGKELCRAQQQADASGNRRKATV